MHPQLVCPKFCLSVCLSVPGRSPLPTERVGLALTAAAALVALADMLTIALRCFIAGTAAAVALKLSKQAVRSRTTLLSAAAGAPCPPRLDAPELRALLISNSKVAGLEYLDHAEAHMKDFLGELSSFVLFVPYAQADRDGYAARVRARFGAMGYELRSMHEFGTADAIRAAVLEASCIFVGGGNTYRLMKCLQEDPALLPLVRERVAAGELLYIGSSAGTNVACPTMRNTNDMPICWPRSLAGLGLVPFQINTHYIDAAREVEHHMGETRETRLQEFMEDNAVPVLGLREGSAVLVRGSRSATLLGPARKSAQVTWSGARLFSREDGCRELADGASLDFLMQGDHDVEALFDTALVPAGGGAALGGGDGGDTFKSG